MEILHKVNIDGLITLALFGIGKRVNYKRSWLIKRSGKNRSTVAQMAARSPHDRKVVGSNPAGSYETRF